MAHYLIGDIQGCAQALERLLTKIGFSPSRDTIYPLGDMVNRGEDSLAVLRRLSALGSSARCILGNHDLHLLAVASGGRKSKAGDTLAAILAAPDRNALLAWLSAQPLARYEHGVLMVHAGVLPQWSTEVALAQAQAVHSYLQNSPNFGSAVLSLWGDSAHNWDALSALPPGPKKQTECLRLSLNALTRIRYCNSLGAMDFACKTDNPPPGLVPWFAHPNRQTKGQIVAFGHWASLGHFVRENLLAMDSGCVWGGYLSALELESGRVAQEKQKPQGSG